MEKNELNTELLSKSTEIECANIEKDKKAQDKVIEAETSNYAESIKTLCITTDNEEAINNSILLRKHKVA